MPKRISKHSQDVAQAAFQMVHQLTPSDEPEDSINTSPSDISRVMAAMGRKGGRIGGKRRLITMTQEQRRKIAQDAAKARWLKHSSTA